MKSKATNIALWVLQVLLAFWSIAGGIYMMTHYMELTTLWASNTFPQPFWIVLGSLEVLFGIGLVLPFKNYKFVVCSAIGLTLTSLFGTAVYISFQGFPNMLWGLLPALLFAFVAFKRSRKV